jgi:flagellar operon protein
MSSPILYPNVTSLPGQGGVKTDPASRDDAKLRRNPDGSPTEFDKVFDRTLNNPGVTKTTEVKTDQNSELSQIRAPLKFSSHATQRLKERNIQLDAATMSKVGDAVDKADQKGVQDTLVLTKDAALIVNVKNRTVVTAMDRAALTGNVFTNIDGAVIV